MGYNLTSQYISASFQQLVQYVDSSSVFVDGTGSAIPSVNITSSNATTASFSISSSYAITSSQAIDADNAAFAVSSSIASTATSASHALNSDSAISSSYAVTSSFATTASFADTSTSASHAEQADNATSSSYAVSASRAVSASHADHADLADDANDVVVGVKNVSLYTITKGSPLHSVGVTGENLNVITASNFNSDMPAIGLAQTDLSPNAAGQAVVSGRLIGFDTDGFTGGDNVYVGVDGALTATRPTGSSLIQNIGIVGKVDATDGELVVLGAGRTNDVPNIAEGNLWVGNSDQVATAVTSQSLWTGKDINVASISASNATFTSASIGYIESITGSAKIIGDAFLILNADTPTQRYAGLSVYDSGSAVTPHTASLQFDGVTNDWFYEYTGSDSTDFGVVMFGPEYGTKGSPSYPSNNRILKGDGGHHLKDSSIQDDGAEVQFFNPVAFNQSVEAGAGITMTGGQLNGTASYALKSNFDTLDNKPAGLVSGSSQIDVTQTQNIWQYVGLNTGNQTISGNKTFSGQTAISGTSLHAVDNSTLGSSGTVNIDFNDANVFYCNPTGTVTFTVSNVPYGTSQTVIVLVENTGQTVNFSGIQFPGGAAPTITSVGIDILTFISINGDVFCIAQQDFS